MKRIALLLLVFGSLVTYSIASQLSISEAVMDRFGYPDVTGCCFSPEGIIDGDMVGDENSIYFVCVDGVQHGYITYDPASCRGEATEEELLWSWVGAGDGEDNCPVSLSETIWVLDPESGTLAVWFSIEEQKER